MPVWLQIPAYPQVEDKKVKYHSYSSDETQ